jgi:DNA-binding Lrp family transcriptional regulator
MQPRNPLVTASRLVASDGIHVLVCAAFDHRVAPDEVAACKKAVTNCPSVIHSMEVSGTFDFIFEAVVPDMAAYRHALESCSGAVAKFASRFEVNFVCEQSVRLLRHRQDHSRGRLRADSLRWAELDASCNHG